jgi:hypothetical protein
MDKKLKPRPKLSDRVQIAVKISAVLIMTCTHMLLMLAVAVRWKSRLNSARRGPKASNAVSY